MKSQVDFLVQFHPVSNESDIYCLKSYAIFFFLLIPHIIYSIVAAIFPLEDSVMTMFSGSKFLLTLSIIAVMVSGVLILSAANAQDGHSIQWTYEGEHGPDHWGDLDESFALCGEGRAQSPIDLTAVTSINLVDIGFDYGETALNIFNNGHTIQVNYDSGSSISYNETTYDLLQFHLHHPSEHTVDGEAAAMELHLVHRDTSGNLAVVGILIVAGEEDNEQYAVIFDNLPVDEGEPQANELVIDATDLLPESATFFTYSGSLTTPPCSQGVRWLVLDTPVVLSESQIEAFATIFELNARPTQDLNRRDLLLDTE